MLLSAYGRRERRGERKTTKSLQTVQAVSREYLDYEIISRTNALFCRWFRGDMIATVASTRKIIRKCHRRRHRHI